MASRVPNSEPADKFERVSPYAAWRSAKPQNLHAQRPVTPERTPPVANDAPRTSYSGGPPSSSARCVPTLVESQRARVEAAKKSPTSKTAAATQLW